MKKLTKEEFIRKSKIKHGNKFDYSLVEYKDFNKSKINIICPIHGIINITPSQHINYDCAKCKGKGKFTTDEIIEQFEKVHGKLYDYSLVEYKGDSKKVKIICREHGLFEIQPNAHKKLKQGCSICGHKKSGENQRLTKEKFIERIENIFGKNKLT